ncbi:MAG: ABC transporter substrate-binding protein [Sulfolobales archaeon]|nr:ABC transporter substrate-binding protein [Sulfolobales archaeon]
MRPQLVQAILVVLIVVSGVAGYFIGQAVTPPRVEITRYTTVISRETIRETVTLPTTITVTTVQTTPITPTPVTTPRFVGTVKVGALLPLNLPIGRMMLAAIQLAVEEINAAGGVLNRRVELVYYDTQWSADKAVEGYKKLAEEGVKVVFGVFASHEALAIMDLLPLYEVLVIASGAVSDAIDAKVLEKYEDYKYWFRAYVNATSQATATWDLLAYISRRFGWTKLAWVYEDLPWVIPHALYGQRRSAQEGIEVVTAIGVPIDIASFTDVFARILTSGAQYITWQFSGTEDYVFARDYYLGQVSLLAVGGGTYAMLDIFYNQTMGAAEGLICISWGFPTAITPKTMEFYEKYKKLVGAEPIFTTWYAYDSVYIWAEAVRKAESFDTDKVIKALETSTFVGTAGIYEFTRSHTAKLAPERIYPVYFQWQRGRRVVIWPFKAVEYGTKLLFPRLVDGRRVWIEIPWP